MLYRLKIWEGSFSGEGVMIVYSVSALGWDMILRCGVLLGLLRNCRVMRWNAGDVDAGADVFEAGFLCGQC
jgi:hypothetical protein